MQMEPGPAEDRCAQRGQCPYGEPQAPRGLLGCSGLLIAAGAERNVESESGETPQQVCERMIGGEDDPDQVQRLEETLDALQATE